MDNLAILKAKKSYSDFMPLLCNYYKAFHNLMTDEVAVYYKIQNNL
jgi:hypothetical protein